ncbi:MAG: exopolysaccharide biosynthesis polyprenyl glycosylphosphotransferase [Actinomycetota bacterium]
MTPPAHEAALTGQTAWWAEAGVVARPYRIRPLRDIVVPLTDSWLLLVLLWATRFYTGSLRPSIALFGVAAFTFVVAPHFGPRRLSASALDDGGPLARRVCFAYAIASAGALVWSPGDSRLVLAVAAMSVPMLFAGRIASRYLERSLSSIDHKTRTLVVGAGEIGRRLISTLATHEEYGLEVVGAVDDNPKFDGADLGTGLLGELTDIPAIVRARRIEVVIVAFSTGDQSNMIDVIRDTMTSGADVWVVPRFFELGFAGGASDHVWGLPMVRLQTPARNRPMWLLKRALDLVLAAVALIVSAPVMGAVAVVTLIDSGLPILHRQRRVSLDGRAFDILKFRTMHVADEAIQDVEWCASESRVTRVGRFFRDTGLDELPQLFNVLKGEMSLVGPRPERPHFVELFQDMYPRYASRHRLPAGVTGWAQIHGLRGNTSIEERAAFDNYYIENWSLGSDLKILLRTAPTLLRKEERTGADFGKEG